ncbi:cytochrome P450 [Streptomyces sp. NBC_00443]|uniref:cytochrome P450 n=1 Tax=Streptomyces sp. NBC_00443 TaxID=2975743 RepID=UPI003FA73B74
MSLPRKPRGLRSREGKAAHWFFHGAAPWFFRELARNPEAHSRVREEIDQHLPHDTIPSVNDLQRLDAACDAPPAPGLARWRMGAHGAEKGRTRRVRARPADRTLHADRGSGGRRAAAPRRHWPPSAQNRRCSARTGLPRAYVRHGLAPDVIDC